MALNKQPLAINFAQGLDLKTDPFQVSPGKFLALSNSIFTKGGLLQKRNGFMDLPKLPQATPTTLTTYSGNLVSISNSFEILSKDTSQWLNKGPIQPVSLSVVPMVRTSYSQTTVDAVIASNGLSCVVYVDSQSNAFYQVVDPTTDQIIVSAQNSPLPAGCVSPRVFAIGNYFIITFVITVSGTYHLQYIAIPINNPSNPGSPTNLAVNLSSLNAAYDGVVANNQIYFAYNASDAGHAIRMFYLNKSLVGSSFKVFAGQQASLISLAVDTSTTTPNIYTAWWNSANSNAYALAVDSNLVQLLAPHQILTGVTLAQITCTANNQSLLVFTETVNTYGFSSVRTDYVSTVTCSLTGVVGTPKIILRSVGLASKAIFYSAKSISYVLVAYGGQYQPTYFLIDQNGNAIAKLAYSNGGGYATTQVLPQANLINNVINIGYLYKDLIESVNKSQNAVSVNNIYSQTGINLASFTIEDTVVSTSEIANDLHMSGGFLWMHAGAAPVEHNFHLWPEDAAATPSNSGGGMSAQEYQYQITYEWTDAQGNIFKSAPSVPLTTKVTAGSSISFTSVFASGATSITVSSAAGLYVGQTITDTTTAGNIQPNTKITSINGTTIGLSIATSGASASSPGDTLQTVDQGSVTLNIPTLRITYKQVIPVRIVIYRWSVAQQNFYKITSVQTPLQNSVTVDSVTYVDTQSDEAIIGNQLIYTTGGVVEDIAAPATDNISLFKSRLFLVDAEDRNLLWYSKQVIEATPVEMSDLFTIYVSPTLSAQGNTGPITALSAMDDKLIIFKKNAIYYLTGNGPDNTGANNDFSEPTFISSTVGCISQKSIVFMPNGLMFQSDKGIWLLGRDLNTSYIGAPVEAYNDANVVSALNIPGTNQVRFTLDSGVTLMYDYYYGQWGTFTNVPAISSTLYQDLHTYVSSGGLVYQESPGKYLDGSNPVLMSFTTSWINLAGVQGYERFYDMLLLGVYYSPFKLNVEIAFDYNSSPQQSVIVTNDNYTPDWGQLQLWGSDGPWGGNGNTFKARVFPSIQKCESFQIVINELYDNTYINQSGGAPGEGLTLSGLNLTVGLKRGSRTSNASRSFG